MVGAKQKKRKTLGKKMINIMKCALKRRRRKKYKLSQDEDVTKRRQRMKKNTHDEVLQN